MYRAKSVKKMKMEIGGVAYEWALSNYALAVLDEEFEEGSIKIISQAEGKPVSAIGKLVYAGIKFSAEEQGVEINYRMIANSFLFDVKLANKIMAVVRGTVDTGIDQEPNDALEDGEDEEKN